MRFLGFESDSYREANNILPQMRERRWLVYVLMWNRLEHIITMKLILKHLELPTVERIITIRILRFPHAGRLTWMRGLAFTSQISEK
jgi:hypothetical protein